MPSAYQDKTNKQWIASFRMPGKKQRKIWRMPKDIATKAKADRLARQIDDACRDIEETLDPHQVDFLIRLGVVNEAQGTYLKRGITEIAGVQEEQRKPVNPLLVTIDEAMKTHQTYRRLLEHDALTDRRKQEHRKHYENAITEFMEFSGLSRLRDIRLAIVLEYVDHMKNKGYKYDTRRHRLLPIRWACMMAPQYGIANVMAGHKIDRREMKDQTDIQTWTWPELKTIIHHLHDANETKLLVAVGLMAFCGLRPSELQRIQQGSIDGDLLQIGKTVQGEILAKNRYSVRQVVMPAGLAEQARKLILKRHKPTTALIRTSRRSNRHWVLQTKLLAAELAQIWPEGVQSLPPKHFRKTFETLCEDEWEIPPRIYEHYAGHKYSGASAVSASHYLGKVQREKMQKWADVLNKKWQEAVVNETGE